VNTPITVDVRAQAVPGESVAAAIRRLDAANDIPALFAHIREADLSGNETFYCLCDLMVRGRLQSAFVVAKLMVAKSIANPAAYLGRAVGGVIFASAADETEGAEQLAGAFARLNADQRTTFRESIATPVFRLLLASEPVASNPQLRARIDTLRHSLTEEAAAHFQSGAGGAAPGLPTMVAIDTARLNAAFADLQTGATFEDRALYAKVLAQATAKTLPEDWRRPASPPVARAGDALRADGLVRLGQVLHPIHAAEVLAYFRARKCFNGQVPNQGDGVRRTVEECVAARFNHGSYPLAEVLTAPHLIELANRQELLDLVENYIGCTPTLYSVNAFWAFPKAPRARHTVQTYHRDHDDFRFCTVFLFLTETKPEDGAHYLIKGSHRKEMVEQAIARAAQKGGKAPPTVESMFDEDHGNMNEACDQLFTSEIELVTAKPGEAVIEDTYAIHKGDIPKTPRLVVWLRYGLYKCKSNYNDLIAPIPRALVASRFPDTRYYQYVNRLIVQAEE